MSDAHGEGEDGLADDTENEENYVMVFSMYIFYGVLGIVGNVLTCRTFWQERRKFILHLQLAVANIISLSSVTMSAPSALRGRWLFGDSMCKWYGFQTFLAGFAETTLTCVICMEYCLALLSTSYYEKLTTKAYGVLSGCVWMFAFIAAISPLGFKGYSIENGSTSCGLSLTVAKNNQLFYYLWITQTIFAICCAVAIVGFVMVLLKGRDKESYAFEPFFQDSEIRKVCYSLFTVLALGCLPYYLRVNWYIRRLQPIFSNFLTIEFSHIAMKMGSAFQPIVYIVFCDKFKRFAKSAITGVTPEKKNN